MLLGDTKLKHLHLLQNCYTTSYLAIAHCSVKAWRVLKRDNPYLKVHLRLESLNDGELVFQPEAPVYSVTYRAPKTMVRWKFASLTIFSDEKMINDGFYIRKDGQQ